MKQYLHAGLVVLAAIPWLFAYGGLCVAAALVMAAHRLDPTADKGNCWSFVGPRWLTMGGYIAIRPVGDTRFLGIFPIIHAIWIKDIPRGTALEQTKPAIRRAGKWAPWWTLYFKYNISKVEKSRTAHGTETQKN
jgi:hypothetical protein